MEYVLSEPDIEIDSYTKKVIKKNINIVNNEELNNIGEINTALSYSWYEEDKNFNNYNKIKLLSKNLYNLVHNKWKCK